MYFSERLPLTGNPRQITIQNTGSASATNVSVSASALLVGTSISSNTCIGTLNAGGSCIITLTPGSIASSDSSSTVCTLGTQPVASTVTVTADGGLSSQVNIYVLGYGCQYQGGFLYSVYDSYADYPETSSIGDNVVSLIDQAEPYINTAPQATSIIWSSNGSGRTSADVDYTTILGIDETSTATVPSPKTPGYPVGTPAYTACSGNSGGACDTNNIVSYYNFNRVSGGRAPTPLTYYAAGLCRATINNYADWYLPAICEMGPATNASGCAISSQNLIDDFPALIGDPSNANPGTSCTLGANCLAGEYWSSTEVSIPSQSGAWYEHFASGGGSVQDFYDKGL